MQYQIPGRIPAAHLYISCTCRGCRPVLNKRSPRRSEAPCWWRSLFRLATWPRVGPLQFPALGLVSLSFGVEAGLDVVVPFGRKLLHATCAHVMIGKRQAIRRDERSRTAVIEAHRRQPHMIQPLLC